MSMFMEFKPSSWVYQNSREFWQVCSQPSAVNMTPPARPASISRNDDTVSIEVCHPDETGEFSPVTYDRVVELTAWLCETFHLDPETDVIRHYDVTEKLCPLYYVEHPEAWDAFRTDVADAMEAENS